MENSIEEVTVYIAPGKSAKVLGTVYHNPTSELMEVKATYGEPTISMSLVEKDTAGNNESPVGWTPGLGPWDGWKKNSATGSFFKVKSHRNRHLIARVWACGTAEVESIDHALPNQAPIRFKFQGPEAARWWAIETLSKWV